MLVIWGLRRLSETISPVETATTVIVCPTPAGGHIEHACDVALATLSATGQQAVLLTRPGAVEYLPTAVTSRVKVLEIIPPLVPQIQSATLVKRVERAAKQLIGLLQEHWRIRKTLGSLPGRKVLLLEEPRYPFPGLLKDTRRRTTVCLMLHNAVEHATSGRSFSLRIKSWIASQICRKVDRIAVHGDRQLALVKKAVDTPARSFALPGDSYLSGLMPYAATGLSKQFEQLSESFVCLGEIRENKGIELAIQAARISSAKVTVLGKAIDPHYLESLHKASYGLPNVEIRDEFLSAQAFEYVISNCKALLLPYSQFGAQSGVLARAMRKSTWIIASDLPSLKEQASAAHNVAFFTAGSSEDLANKMCNFEPQTSETTAAVKSADLNERCIPQWDELALAVQAGW